MSLRKSYWVISGAYSIGARFSTLLFGFGGFYFLVRSLTKEQFGIWALFLTITTIVEMSRNGLIQNALIKLLHASASEESHKIVTASWVINLLYSLLIILLLIGFSTAISIMFGAEEFRPMFLYYGITLLLLVPFSQFNYIQQARFSFSGIFWSVAVRQGFFFGVILVYYLLDLQITLLALVLYQALGTFFGAVTAYFCARKYSQFNWSVDMSVVWRVFHFGKYVMGTNISSLLYKSTDQLMIGYFLNVSSLAIYNSAIRLSNLIEYPATSVAEVVYPKSSEMFERDKDDASRYFYEKAVGLTMTITLPIVIVTFLFADTIIYIVAGPLYSQSAEVLRVTILFGLFTPFSRQFGTAMDSSGRPHLNFLVLCISVIINVATNYIGITAFGMIGAAYGTLVSYVIASIICYIFMVRIFKIRFVNVFVYMFDFYGQAFRKARSILSNQ